MKTIFISLLSLLLLPACGGSAARSKRPAQTSPAAVQVQPKTYTYRIAATYPHSTTAYTQGLYYDGSLLWEGTGQYGESLVQTVDLTTGKTSVLTRLPRSEFGEGIARVGDELFQLTWQSNTAHVYDLKNGCKKIRDHRYPGEGWGLTTDGTKLYMSDGTATIYTVEPATFRREKRVTVTFQGAPVNYLNELEWIGGRIWANVYTTEQIVIIDPATGIVEGVVDLTGILPEEEMTPATDVLNGIAYDAERERIFVTGKNWPKLYEIELIEK